MSRIVLLAVIGVVVSCTPVAPVVPDVPDVPPEQCPTPAIVAATGLTVEATTTSTLPDASCGAGRVAQFTFTPPRDGSYLVRASDGIVGPVVTGLWTSAAACGAAETCALASTLLLPELVAGEAVVIGARASEREIELEVVPVDVVADGESCDEAQRFCGADSVCVRQQCASTAEVTSCAAPLVIEDRVYTTVTLGRTPLPAASCGADDEHGPLSAVLRWTAPRAGRFVVGVPSGARVVIATDDCAGAELACFVTGFGANNGLDVEAGDRLILIVEYDQPAIVVIAGLIATVAEGGSCNGFGLACETGLSCIFEPADVDTGNESLGSCRLVETGGTCAAPRPIIAGEETRVTAERRQFEAGFCNNSGGTQTTVFSFTATQDVVIVGGGSFAVFRDRCGGEELLAPCERATIDVLAGETVVIQLQNVFGEQRNDASFYVRFTLNALRPVPVGGSCEPPITDAFCAGTTFCLEDECRPLQRFNDEVTSTDPIMIGRPASCPNPLFLSSTAAHHIERYLLTNDTDDDQPVLAELYNADAGDTYLNSVIAIYDGFVPEQPTEHELQCSYDVVASPLRFPVPARGRREVVVVPIDRDAIVTPYDLRIAGNVVVSRVE